MNKRERKTERNSEREREGEREYERERSPSVVRVNAYTPDYLISNVLKKFSISNN